MRVIAAVRGPLEEGYFDGLFGRLPGASREDSVLRLANSAASGPRIGDLDAMRAMARACVHALEDYVRARPLAPLI